MAFDISTLVSALMRDLKISLSDQKYVLRRLSAEGIVFLTEQLPLVARAVITGLETGKFDRTGLTSFSFCGSILKFLRGSLNKIFDEKTGCLLISVSGADVGTIRQLCEYSYKLAIPSTREKEQEAGINFEKNEAELLELGRNPEVLAFANQLRKDFETHWSDISRTKPEEIFQKFRPRPTNGTFCGSDELYYLNRVSTARAGAYPSDMEPHKGFFKPYPGDKTSDLKKVNEASYSELLFVPKDSRGPRTICREHLIRVETQMAYFDFMCEELTRGSKGAINFADQTVNRRIAELSSVTKTHSTLDLKDASDRVSLQVIKTIFRNSGLYYFVTGSRRATHVKLPDLGGVEIFVRLNKLAGMGSGLTFPTMSLLISLAICNLVKRSNPNLQYDDIRKSVFIYGDDICLPTEWADIASVALAKIGLKVNKNKSFIKGNFRESCGGDYFAGLNVTPVRLKLTNSKVDIDGPRTLRFGHGVNSFLELYTHSQELWKQGFFCASKCIIRYLNSEHKRMFGSQMPKGRFDEESVLFVDYTTGTGHLCVYDQSEVMTVSPERIRGLDDRKVISKSGSSKYERSRAKYLGSTLRVVERDKVSIDRHGKVANVTNYVHKSLERLAIERTNPSASLTFDELTIPRKLRFSKKLVPNDFLITEFKCTREQVLEDLNRSKFFEELAHLTVGMAFLGSCL